MSDSNLTSPVQPAQTLPRNEPHPAQADKNVESGSLEKSSSVHEKRRSNNVEPQRAPQKAQAPRQSVAAQPKKQKQKQKQPTATASPPKASAATAVVPEKGKAPPKSKPVAIDKKTRADGATPIPTSQPIDPTVDPTIDPTLAVRMLRRARALRMALRFAIGVGIPTIASGVYYGLVASDLFQSTSLFTIQSTDSRGTMGLDSIMGIMPGSSPATRDAMAVREYILSRDMLLRLNTDHLFTEHYKNQDFDWFARLDIGASNEDAFEYYRERIEVEHDPSSGVISLRVKAFSAESSTAFSEAILHYSEEMVNQLSERSRRDQTQFARSELTVAEARLGAARKNVLALQSERSEFSPEHSASATLSVRGALQSELASATAQLNEAMSFMSSTAPKVVSLRQRVSALAAQVSRESSKLVNPKAKGGLNTSIATFESAILEKEFARSAYQSALTSLELARSDAGRQHRYLARIAQPSNPDEATFPKRIIGVFTTFILSIAVLGIASLFGAAIREHARL